VKQKMAKLSRRRGLGKGKGKGYKNILRTDPLVHSRAAKGQKTYSKALLKRLEQGLKKPKWVRGLSWSNNELRAISLGHMTESYRATYPQHKRIPASHMMGASQELAEREKKVFRHKQNHVATKIRGSNGKPIDSVIAKLVEDEFRKEMDKLGIRFDSDWQNNNSKWKLSQFRHLTPVNKFTESGRRTNVLSWDDWVKVNNALNKVMDNWGLSANIKTLGGKFVVRQGKHALTEKDWEHLKYENVGSIVNPITREDWVKKAPQQKTKYALFWKGKRLPNMTFDTKEEAETARGIEVTQMELAEYTPQQLQKNLKIKKV